MVALLLVQAPAVTQPAGQDSGAGACGVACPAAQQRFRGHGRIQSSGGRVQGTAWCVE